MESNLEAILSGEDAPKEYKEIDSNDAKNDTKIQEHISKSKELKLNYQREYFCLTGYEG